MTRKLLHTVVARLAAVEARLDVEGGYSQTIYEQRRRAVRTELGVARIENTPGEDAAMPRRIKYTGQITAGHHNFTGFAEAATVPDVRYIRVDVPELPWLDRIEISIDHDHVKVDMYPADENRTTPTVVMHDDGSIKLTA